MRYRTDLGLPGAVLVVVFFFGPIFLLVIRRKWRIAAERKEEILRLVLLASEEATRAEFESHHHSISYVSDSLPGSGAGIVRHQCAVCYSPTTTRCSRCKAVRYCSGKCQIIHWRQGHKEECHPPHIDDQYNGQGSISDLTGAQAKGSKLYDNNLETEGKSHAEPVETFSGRPASSESICSSNVFSQDGNLEGKPLLDTSGTESTSDSFSISSSSSCSTFTFPAETSDDASASEDPLLVIHARKVETLSCDTSPDGPRAAVDVSQSNLSKFPSKFASARYSVNTVPCSSNSKQKASGCKIEEVECGSNGRLSSSTEAEPSEDNGECQSVILGSNVAQSAGDDNITNHQFSQEGDDIQSVSGSPFKISSKLSEQALPSQASSGDQNSSCVAARDSTASGFKSSSVATGSSNDILLQKSKGLRSLSSVSYVDHASSNFTSSNICKAPTVPSRSSESTDAAPNGSSDLKTSVRRVVQQFKYSKHSRHYSSGTGNVIPGKYNYKMLFPYDLFIKLYNCDKVDLRPCGLTNCGNSCYANAVLQCLAFTRPLTAYFLQGLHTKTCPKKGWCFTCEFESLLMKAKLGKSPLSPIGILSHIQNIGSHLGHGREEDAHEFLRYAIDAMQSVCLKEAGGNAGGSLAEETTLIQLIFGGYLRSKIRCIRCQGKSERRERMMDLTVEIHGDVGTLEEALARFTATEILDGENKYYCDRCKSYERAKKKLTVLEAPNVLTIALKRFQSGKFGKLNKAVRFPEILNIDPYMSTTNDKSPVYKLYAVVVHLDIMNAAFSGHYVCYVKNTQGKWYKIDDSVVKPVELERVLSKGAYMLLYARCSPRAPSLIRNPMSHDHKSKSMLKEVVLSGHNGESRARSSPTFLRPDSSVGAHHRNGDIPYRSTYDPTNFEPVDLFNERFLFRTDSSSDSSSLLSCSDEGSWSTESTRDSTSTEEYSEYIFGESGCFSLNSPLRYSEDSDGFSRSPLVSRHSPGAVSNGHMSDSSRSGNSTLNVSSSGREDSYRMKGLSYEADRVEVDRIGMRQPQESREVYFQGKESPHFLYSDQNEQCRKLTEQCSSRETNWAYPYEGKSSLSSRRSTRETTTQTFY